MTTNDELKEKIKRYESQESEPSKMTPEEIRAELEAHLDTALDAYVSDSLRSKRLAETTSARPPRRPTR